MKKGPWDDNFRRRLNEFGDFIRNSREQPGQALFSGLTTGLVEGALAGLAVAFLVGGLIYYANKPSEEEVMADIRSALLDVAYAAVDGAEEICEHLGYRKRQTFQECMEFDGTGHQARMRRCEPYRSDRGRLDFEFCMMRFGGEYRAKACTAFLLARHRTREMDAEIRSGVSRSISEANAVLERGGFLFTCR